MAGAYFCHKILTSLNRSKLAVKMEPMKLGGILALTAALALTGCSLQEQPPVSQKVQDYYDNAGKPTAEPDKMVISIIGDSYVGGSGMGGNGVNNWTSLIVGELPEPDKIEMYKSGMGGSGYVTRGPTRKIFSEAIPGLLGAKSDVVVFFGSINDRGESPEMVGASAAATYAEAKKAAPNAKLLVIGPAWTSDNVPSEMLAIRDALHTAALEAGATWVDPIAEQWFFDRAALIGSDKTHPTNEGHAYMEQKILPYLTALVKG